MGANSHANGGLLLRDLKMPDFRDYAVDVPTPGTLEQEATRVMGNFLRDVMKKYLGTRNFRIMEPDETTSNRLSAVFDVTNRISTDKILENDEHISHDGRVMEVLSEHMCQGWLEGYLLTGRQYTAVGHGPLFAQSSLRECHCCRQATGTAISQYG